MATEQPATSVEVADVLDLEFTLRGRRVPADHGYALYGALCHALPALHGTSWLGVHPIRGEVLVDGLLRLPDRAQLRLRLPAAQIPQVLPLAGKTLVIADQRLIVGVPQVRPLQAATSLDARLVLIKLTEAPRKADGALDKDAMKAAFLAELGRQMEELGVSAEVALPGRQQLTVGGRRVVGWSVRLFGLDAEASLHVQARGLGGKRAMGCGIFVPTRNSAGCRR